MNIFKKKRCLHCRFWERIGDQAFGNCTQTWDAFMNGCQERIIWFDFPDGKAVLRFGYKFKCKHFKPR